MLFNSLEFAAFLPIVLALYYLARRARFQNPLLVVAGYAFYGYWDVRFLFLLSLSSVIDFSTALLIENGRMTLAQRAQASVHAIGSAALFLVVNFGAIHFGGPQLVEVRAGELLRHEAWPYWTLAGTVGLVLVGHVVFARAARLPEATRRRFFLGASLVGQLGLLGVFKYYDFFAKSANEVVHRFGGELGARSLGVLLPVGISFYTFQTLSYVWDVYRSRVKPIERLVDFALYVAYFPPLVAGPIARAEHLVPQLLRDRKIDWNHAAHGAVLILTGLFKKMVIADGLAPAVDSVFGSSSSDLVGLEVAAATLGFALQIYGDFSGYSDIACGTSLFLGIRLDDNFNLPYFSVNPSEFWRRWHMSLSSWLRDYLYIPLGGNRGSERRTYANLMTTMVLGGLWHGAAWNYVLWGAYQGVLLAVHRFFAGVSPRAAPQGLMARLPRMAFFFLFVCYGWLLFRATSFQQIGHFTRLLFTGPWTLSTERHMHAPTVTALLGTPLLVLWETKQFMAGSALFYRSWPTPVRSLFYATLVLLVVASAANAPQQFIYFQF